MHLWAWHNELTVTPFALKVVQAHWDPGPRKWHKEGAESSRTEPFLSLQKVLPLRLCPRVLESGGLPLGVLGAVPFLSSASQDVFLARKEILLPR